MPEAMLRIALGGIHIESSTFTPYRSGFADFQVRRGAEYAEKYPWITGVKPASRLGDSGPASLANIDVIEGVAWLPLIHAGALPGGPVTAEFYQSWKTELFDRLAEVLADGPIDGFFFDIHGAMSVEGITDAEGELAAELRRYLGPDVVIATAMDLHGNVSELLFENVDLLTCYRTAPHIDAPETRYRAVCQLVEYLRNPRPLYRARVAVPILLPGEKTSTKVEPGSSLYAMIEPRCDGNDVIDCSIWMGFPWADEPRLHGVVVTQGYDQEKVAAAAKEVAQYYWSQRDNFVFVGPTDTTEGAVAKALASDNSPFFISDTGDNPGAGGAGDMVVLLREVLRQQSGGQLKVDSHGLANQTSGERQSSAVARSILFASIYDPQTLAQAVSVGIGGSAEFQIGGKLDPAFGGPVNLTATVERLWDSPNGGQLALLSCDNNHIIVTSQRTQYVVEQMFAEAGYPEFKDIDIICVKIGYLEPDLAEAAQDWVMALTPGAVDQDLPRLGHRRIVRPLVPFDCTFDAELGVDIRLRSPQVFPATNQPSEG